MRRMRYAVGHMGRLITGHAAARMAVGLHPAGAIALNSLDSPDSWRPWHIRSENPAPRTGGGSRASGPVWVRKAHISPNGSRVAW
jgi:hypothetical protein